MAHIWTITPTGGSALNLNDRTNTFLCTDHNIGAKKGSFDEVRNGLTGAVCQARLHYGLIKMTMPMFVVGTGLTPADDLYDRLVLIKAACVAGGVATYQAPGEISQSFTIGASDEPEYLHDYLYINDHIAQLKSLELWRMP